MILPDDIQPGDLIECHGVRQRVTHEFGAYAAAPGAVTETIR